MNSNWPTQPWVRLSLVATGGLLGAVAFFFAPELLISAISKTAAIFLGTVWVTIMGFALKVADVTETPALTTEEHERLELMTRRAVRRVWTYAGLNAVMAVIVLLPSILLEAKFELSPWVLVSAGAAIGISIHSVIVHAWWQEELRRFRSTLRSREREENRVEALVKKMEGASGLPLTEDIKSEIAAHNTVIDWPTNSGPH